MFVEIFATVCIKLAVFLGQVGLKLTAWGPCIIHVVVYEL